MITRFDLSDLPAAWEPTVLECARSVVARQHLLLIGPPGTATTMIARRLIGLVPLTEHAQRWITAEYDAIFGDGPVRVIAEAPFRAPHHTISQAALVGSTRMGLQIGPHPAVLKLPRVRVSHPGEVDLARFGVLLLDEVAEFSLGAITALRVRLDAMESGAPVVVATATPCPCGWFGSSVRECTCTEDMRKRWSVRIDSVVRVLSIGSRVDVAPLSMANLRETFKERCRSTESIREAVIA